MSDTDDSRTIQSAISTPSSTRKKRTVNIGTRSNKSHTAYFFRIDANNSEITYCKICECDPTEKAYPYSRKGGNTSTLIAHLRDKHGITKNNFTEYLDDNKEV
jgi:BED zinc finger